MSESDPPREVSNQNREEPSAPQSPDRTDADRTEAADQKHDRSGDRPGHDDEGTPGGSGEGSQATGHPGNAG